MNTLLFLTSHVGSDSALLYNTLAENKRIQGISLGGQYDHPTIAFNITSLPHKLRDSSAIYMDHILYNYTICHDNFYKTAKFIYLVREARPSLDVLMSRYSPTSALMYYTFRLRRMCETAKKTPGAVWLTWEDMMSERGLALIEQYLGLKTKIKSIRGVENVSETQVPSEMVEKAQKSYEFYLYMARKFELLTLK